MSQRRFGRSQKAITLLPLALLSAAWTAGLAAPSVSLTSASEQTTADLPDGVEVPVVDADSLQAPGSLSRPGAVAPGVPAGRSAQAVRTASTNGIPAAALAAYQRAETVINRADQGCNIPWQLVAAIGRVESDHGRFGGNVLDSDGVAQPGIRGIPLDGSNGTARIADTDAGQLDGDRQWDRAVGPMQFIPSTWSVVGVDADGDGERNPQDIDDAALASAVYLCSGDDDLSTTEGQRAAVFRYNNSDDYVDLVLSIMEAYTEGDFSSVPTATAAGNSFEPQPDAPRASAPGDRLPGGGGGSGDSSDGSTGRIGGGGGGNNGGGSDGGNNGGGGGDNGGGGSDGGNNGGGGGDNGGGGSDGGNNGGGGGGGGDNGGGGGGGGGGVEIPDPTQPVRDLLTEAEARVICIAQLGNLVNGLLGGQRLAECIDEELAEANG